MFLRRRGRCLGTHCLPHQVSRNRIYSFIYSISVYSAWNCAKLLRERSRLSSCNFWPHELHLLSSGQRQIDPQSPQCQLFWPPFSPDWSFFKSVGLLTSKCEESKESQKEERQQLYDTINFKFCQVRGPLQKREWGHLIFKIETIILVGEGQVSIRKEFHLCG